MNPSKVIEADAGSPARAGIDRVFAEIAEIGPRFPRTRGDRPYHSVEGMRAEKVPPHARG